MADGNIDIQAQVGDPYGAQNAGNLTQIVETQKSMLDGITESKSIARQQLDYVSDISVDVGKKGWFFETLNKLVGSNEESRSKDEEAYTLQESIKESLDKMNLLDETTEKDRLINKKKKGKVSRDVKLDELKQLPYEFATLGAVLYSALTNKDEKKDKEKGGLSDIFKGLMEGVGGIAALGVALLAFAGATLIFNFVDWGQALVGLLAFTVFTLGMIKLATLMKDETKNLVKFAEVSLLMSAALGVFAISLYMVSAVVGSKGITLFGKEIVPPFKLLSAIEGITLFLGFIAGVALVSHLLGKEQKNLTDFAKASLLMSAALGVFAISLWLVSAVVQAQPFDFGPIHLAAFDMLSAIEGLAVFLGFITALALISNLASSNQGEFESFAEASILMSVSLVAFSLALIIVSNIFTGGPTKFGPVTLPAIDVNGAVAGLLAFGGFILAFTALAAIADSASSDIKKFTVTSILMSVSLAVFSISMVIVSNVFKGAATEITSEGASISLGPVDLGAAIVGIASFVIFVAAFIGLSALANSFAGNLAMFAGVSMLMSVSLTLFAGALMAAGIAAFGGEATIAGKAFSAPEKNGLHALAAIGDMAAFMLAFIGLGAIFLIPFAGQAMMAGLIMASTALTMIAATTMLFAKAMMMAGGVVNGGEFEIEGKHYKLEKYDKEAVEGMFGIMTNFIQKMADVAGQLGVKGTLALAVISRSITPIVDTLDKMVGVVLKASENKEKILEIVNGDSNALDHLLDPALYVILGPKLDGRGGLMKVAQQMDKKGAKVLQLVSQSLGPITGAMDKMIDVVIHAVELDVEQIPVAINNLQAIMFGPGQTEDDGMGNGFLSMFALIAESAKHTSKKAVEAIKSMPSVVEALGGLVDVIAKAGELDPNKIQAGVFGLNAVADFLKKFIETINEIIPGGVGGAISKFFGGNPEDKLKSAHEYLQPGGLYYNIFEDLANIAQKFDGKGFENLGKVAVVGAFTADLLKSSEHLKDILGNIQKGVEKFKNPSAINVIADGLERLANVGDISSKFDPLYQLIEKQVQLKSVADEMDRIAKSYNKLAAAEKVGDIGNKVAGFAKGLFGNKKKEEQSNGASIEINTSEDTGLMSVEEIMNEWYKNGVNIKPQPGQAPVRPNALNV